LIYNASCNQISGTSQTSQGNWLIPQINERYKARNFAFDYLRIIGIFGIVFFHGAQEQLTRQIGYSGLIIFILISINLSVLRDRERNISKYIATRATRLLVPWLFWFTVYGLQNIARDKSFLPEGHAFNVVLAGTNIILWYLPFLFIVLIITAFYDNKAQTHSIFKTCTLYFVPILSIILLISTPIWRPWSLELGYPWAQWFHAAPAVLIGIALVSLTRQYQGHLRVSLYSGIIVLISLWLILIGNYNGVGIPYLLGVLLFSSHLYWKSNAEQNHALLLKISDCTFGIYLIHPLVSGMEYKMGFPETAALPVMTFVLSLTIILIIKNIPIHCVQKVI
jgi:surface polysaccharide O-acyltransferase-like enzyme